MKCLMIELKDQRKFFTYEKYFPQLIEFSKMFDAELSIVKAKEVEILDLVTLAPAICNSEYSIKKPDIEIIEIKRKRNNRTRSKILDAATKIKSYIEEEFLKGESLKLSKVANKFRRYNLTLACFCQHMRSVRKKLEKQGFQFTKTGAGEYQVINNN